MSNRVVKVVTHDGKELVYNQLSDPKPGCIRIQLPDPYLAVDEARALIDMLECAIKPYERPKRTT